MWYPVNLPAVSHPSPAPQNATHATHTPRGFKGLAACISAATASVKAQWFSVEFQVLRTLRIGISVVASGGKLTVGDGDLPMKNGDLPIKKLWFTPKKW